MFLELKRDAFPLPTAGEGCSLLAKAKLELRDELGEGVKRQRFTSSSVVPLIQLWLTSRCSVSLRILLPRGGQGRGGKLNEGITSQ